MQQIFGIIPSVQDKEDFKKNELKQSINLNCKDTYPKKKAQIQLGKNKGFYNLLKRGEIVKLINTYLII